MADAGGYCGPHGARLGSGLGSGRFGFARLPARGVLAPATHRSAVEHAGPGHEAATSRPPAPQNEHRKTTRPSRLRAASSTTPSSRRMPRRDPVADPHDPEQQVFAGKESESMTGGLPISGRLRNGGPLRRDRRGRERQDRPRSQLRDRLERADGFVLAPVLVTLSSPSGPLQWRSCSRAISSRRSPPPP